MSKRKSFKIHKTNVNNNNCIYIYAGKEVPTFS